MNDPATTRFQNDQVRAKQQQSLMPQAASAFRTKIAGNKSKVTPEPDIALPPRNRPTGNVPGFKPMYEPEPDPVGEIVKPPPNPVDMLVKEIQVDRLINSPEMANANTLQKLRENFRGRKSTSQERGAEVLGILSNYVTRRK